MDRNGVLIDIKINLQGKYSDLHVLIDEDDYDIIKEYNWNGRKGSFCNVIYAITTCRKNLLMHRLIMEKNGHKIEGLEIDHIDHNGLNNQKSNLRVVTKRQNKRNNYIFKGKSKYKWVKVEKTGNYFVQISMRHGKSKIYYKLGTYINEEIAARVADLFVSYVDSEHYVINGVLPHVTFEETKKYKRTHRNKSIDADMETTFDYVLKHKTMTIGKVNIK